MFDKSQKRTLGSESPGAQTPPQISWKSLPVELLIKYIDEIRQHLPMRNLVEMDLEEELILQYQTIRALQNDVLQDQDVPVNQRAQVANAVAAALGKLADLQNETYSSERFKKVETILIRHARRMPEDLAKAFLEDYAALLEVLK